jgi:hypothetical protein
MEEKILGGILCVVIIVFIISIVMILYYLYRMIETQWIDPKKWNKIWEEWKEIDIEK